MPSAFLPLLRAGRFTECRELAEKTLLRMGHTIREAAQSHHAIATCEVAEGDLAIGITVCEKALELSTAAEDWDLSGTVLVDLAGAYHLARRYRRQVWALQRYLEMFDRLDKSRCHEVQALWSLGLATFQLGELDHAVKHLRAGLNLAVRLEEHRVANQCRHLLRQALIRSGELQHIPPLLAETKNYLYDRYDESAAYDYWYDFADYLIADGQSGEAFEQAILAMLLAEGDPEREVECAMLLHRCAERKAELEQAAAYLLLARARALQVGRHDLAYDVNQHIDQLLEKHGSFVLEDANGYFRGTGLNPFQYIPARIAPRLRGIAEA